MKVMEKSWRKPVFRRLVFSFICILLPLYILSIIIYNWGIGTLRQSILNTMSNQVSFYLKGFEEDMRRIQRLQFDCLRDINLIKLSSIPDSMDRFEKLQAFLSLQQRIYAIKNSSVYIKDVTILIPSIDYTITSDGPVTCDRDLFDRIRLTYLKRGAQIADDERGMFLYASYPYFTKDNELIPSYIISVELSRDKIQEAMGSMATSRKEVLLFYNPETKARISFNSNPVFDREVEKQEVDFNSAGKTESENVKIAGKNYLAVHAASDFFHAAFYRYIPENLVYQPLWKFQGWFVVITFVALVIMAAYSFYLYEFINKPLVTLAKSFRKIENGELNVSIDAKRDNEFGYIYKRFNAMVENLNILIDQVYKNRILAQKAEMKQLQSQINPHFLYNSFFTINAMAQIEDLDNLQYFTKQLGEYFQFVTRNASDEVTLDREVSHARIYTEIQARRFSKRIQVEFGEPPAKYSKLMVPRLILQPVIENAFVYGLENKYEGGMLQVGFADSGNGLDVIVEDNGSELDDKKLETLNDFIRSGLDDIEVTGMMNIYRRIRLKFGGQSGIAFDRGELGGLRVTISIKLAGAEKNVQAVDC